MEFAYSKQNRLDDRELADLLGTVRVDREQFGNRPVADVDGHPHGAGRLAVLAIRPGDAGHRQTDVAAQAVPHRSGHLSRRLTRHHFVHGYGEQVMLHRPLVRHDPAGEPFTGSLVPGERLDEQTSGQRFGDADRPT